MTGRCRNRHLLTIVILLSSAAGSPLVQADSGSSLRVHFAKSSETDFVTVVAGDYQQSQEANGLVGVTWGHHLSDTLFGLPFPTTVNLGLQSFDEKGHQPNGMGTTAFVKAHHVLRVPFTGKHVQLGLGEGLSYVTRIPVSEQRDFAKKGTESEKLLNYMEWTIDVPLSQFASIRPMFENHLEEFSVGFIVWHRSSIFGLMADDKGGVNFMGFGFEAKY